MEPIGTWSGFLFCGHESIKFISVNFLSVNRQEPCLVAMVPLAFDTCRKNLAPIFTQPPAQFVLILHEVTIFISNCVEAEHWFLGAPGAKTEPALRQGIVFFRLRPKKDTYFCLSLCNSFTREARKEHCSKRFPTGSQASQQCISVPRCMFLQARNTVEAFTRTVLRQ